MRALAMTGIETASMMPSIMSGSDARAMPPSLRMSAGTRSSAMTATAPASSAIFACSALTTSMITPPLSISAMPRLTRAVPVVVGVASGVVDTVNLTGAERKGFDAEQRLHGRASGSEQRRGRFVGEGFGLGPRSAPGEPEPPDHPLAADPLARADRVVEEAARELDPTGRVGEFVDQLVAPDHGSRESHVLVVGERGLEDAGEVALRLGAGPRRRGARLVGRFREHQARG